MLFFTCLVTPYRLAFYLEAADPLHWEIINGWVDISFTVDMILMFFTCNMHENGIDVNDNRKDLIKKYLVGWFPIDFLSVFPFEKLMTSSGDYAGMVRIFRVSKLYKIVKIMRLIKVMKLMQARKKAENSTENLVKVDKVVERFGFFIFMSFILIHVSTCIWVLIPKIDPTSDKSWIRVYGFETQSNTHVYIASFYFVTQTCTTVGYGDLSPTNTLERSIAIFYMFFGVVGFTYGTAFVGAILQGIDDAKEIVMKKKSILVRMQRRYTGMSQTLVEVIEKNLFHTAKNDWALESEILGDLNCGLRRAALLMMYKDHY
jgi:hypothetical protein